MQPGHPQFPFRLPARLRKGTARLLFLACLMPWLWACNSMKKVPEDQSLLVKNKVKVSRGGTISKSDISNTLTQEPNSKALGFRLKLTLYNWSKDEKDNWWNNKLREMGEKPVIFDSSSIAASQKRILSMANSKGYFQPDLSSEVKRKGKDKRKVVVTYRLDLDEPYHIRDIRLDVEDDSLQAGLARWEQETTLLPGMQYEVSRLDAERVGLTIWSVHLPFGRAWDISSPDDSVRTAVVDRIAWFIEAVQPLRPRKMILHPSAEPIADSLRGLHIEHSICSINTLAAVAARYDAQLLVEDLPRTCLCNTSREMLSIFKRLDPAVGVCFDTNHLLQETPEAFARALSGRIASLHVSDYDAVDEKHWIMGCGSIDWPAVITALADIGYNGVFLFEVGGYNSFQEVAESWHKLKQHLESEANN